ncbi:protein kinase, partial [bacterium]|nr:protein kinase [bacterium]
MTDNLPDPRSDWTAQDLTNSVLGRYHVRGRIGSGGMGEVYKATDTLLKRNVALKRVLPHFAQQEQSKKRLIREARAVSALSHPNIAGLYDVLEKDGETFLVMELVNGKPLHSGVNSPMQLEIFLPVAKQCLEALDAAHSKGIIHGDLKPSNVFLNESQNVKILDFGVARSVIAPEIVSTTVPKLTETGPEYGTLPYLAPEALTGKESDQRRDLFALGIIFYELLTGTYPFKAETVAAIAARIVNDQPNPPSDVNRKLPKELDALIFHLLEKDPAKRYSTAAEVLTDLNSFERNLAEQTVSAQLKSIIRLPKRNQVPSVLKAIILILLLIVLGILIQRQFVKETPVFAERNWILLADFENTTGNVIFDQTLNEGLTVALQQSSHVNVFSRSRAFEALQRMTRKGVKRIDEAIGREICQRENLQVLLAGSIYRSGDMYQITLRAIEPENGKLLFVEKEQFAKMDELFQKVDTLAKVVREQLGESQARIEKSARPLAKVTTPSLEALRLYSQASDTFDRGDIESARVLLVSALSLDRNFAMAHHLLAQVYELLGHSDQYV